MEFVDFSYCSSFDGTSPLRAIAACPRQGDKLPLVICMHSYGGDRRGMIACLAGRAQRGMLAVAPDMRGRADSAGRGDDGGLEIADIYDAVIAAGRLFADRIDPNSIHMVGWSGGGGSVYQAFVRMPELFNSAQAFYGIADYGYLANSSPDWRQKVTQRVGQTPEQAPVRYRIRNAVEAVGNNPMTPMHLFWDEQETLCPPEMNRRFLQRAQLLGLKNIHAFESKEGDTGRWVHGAEIHGELAEAVYEPRIVSGEFPRPSLPSTGTLLIPGFLITRRFTFCLGSGEDTVAMLDYTWNPNSAILKLSQAEGQPGACGWARFASFNKVVQVRVNGQPHPGLVRKIDDPEHDYLYNIGLTDHIQIEW
jgi:dienelactone hydrolase